MLCNWQAFPGNVVFNWILNIRQKKNMRKLYNIWSTCGCTKSYYILFRVNLFKKVSWLSVGKWSTKSNASHITIHDRSIATSIKALNVDYLAIWLWFSFIFVQGKWNPNLWSIQMHSLLCARINKVLIHSR